MRIIIVSILFMNYNYVVEIKNLIQGRGVGRGGGNDLI